MRQSLAERDKGGRQIVSDIEEFDVIVLGAGPAGEVCAGRLAEAELSVALVEQELIGGECSFYACMPSKALLRPAQALAEARRVAGAAEAATGELDVAAALARRDEIIHDLDDSAQLPWLRRSRHRAGARSRRAGGRAARCASASGCSAARRAIVLAPGTARCDAADRRPARGAPVDQPRGDDGQSRSPARCSCSAAASSAVELAQAYASLGARVTIVEALDRLISREEEFASELVREALQEAGVEVVLGVEATAVERGGRRGRAR